MGKYAFCTVKQRKAGKETRPMERITSRTNPLCTHIRKLASSASYRRSSGEFLCDSPKLLEEALLRHAALRTVICTENTLLPVLPENGSLKKR